ncbi:MAG: bifunctional 4-hydroxy-2-oxoglutarate aldolase/2-dehydro-3-deoxy-phosphogluconate aldolase [Bacteroidales bacterium]|nr:bifunctional 4-hydroxy-2-oxoglutarate aldolase/2-dehydro-3-deoxy-phosphogluconate aldolase [Bacteroidales bacterium]
MVNRLHLYSTIAEQGMVPLYYNSDAEMVKNVISACYQGGGRVFEFTNRGVNAHEVFAVAYKYAQKELPGMIIGVGSVIDAPTAALYMQMGAGFIVSPLLNIDVAKICNKRKVAWMAGCGSVTEISTAEEYGAEIVKLFPGQEVGGASFIKNVKGPMPWTSIMPSGGVEPTRANLTEWFSAGAFCVGMGSKLITKDIIVHKDFNKLTGLVRDTLALIKSVRDA